MYKNTDIYYIIELTKIFGYDSNEFKLHFMNNVEKYQWVIPTLKKLDYDIKYSDPFEKYFKNINNIWGCMYSYIIIYINIIINTIVV